MWFKKKAYISGYNSNTAVDGTDWRTTAKHQMWSVSHTLPSTADAGKYFYLPALGVYISGTLNDVSHAGHYWSSSADPDIAINAYGLDFSYSYVTVRTTFRFFGYRVDWIE